VVKQRAGLAEADEGYEMEKNDLPAEYGLTKMRITTVYRWMVCLGFKCQE
jgi:hypothetical protein